MHYLIDGHNLIAKMASVNLGDPDDEAELVLLLRSWSAGNKKRQVTVIFDGGLPGGENRLLSTSNVKVFFASANRTADDLLKSRVRQLSNPSEYTMITDDREVIAEVQKRKVSLLSSETFAEMIEQVGLRDNDSESARDPELSNEELVEWLELFDRDKKG